MRAAVGWRGPQVVLPPCQARFFERLGPGAGSGGPQGAQTLHDATPEGCPSSRSRFTREPSGEPPSPAARICSAQHPRALELCSAGGSPACKESAHTHCAASAARQRLPAALGAPQGQRQAAGARHAVGAASAPLSSSVAARRANMTDQGSSHSDDVHAATTTSSGGTGDGFSPQGLKARPLPAPARPWASKCVMGAAGGAAGRWVRPGRPLKVPPRPPRPCSQVLVVDDDPMCLKVVSAMLQRCNYEGGAAAPPARPPARRHAACAPLPASCAEVWVSGTAGGAAAALGR